MHFPASNKIPFKRGSHQIPLSNTLATRTAPGSCFTCLLWKSEVSPVTHALRASVTFNHTNYFHMSEDTDMSETFDSLLEFYICAPQLDWWLTDCIKTD